MRTAVMLLSVCAGCAFITDEEYDHRMSAKAPAECAFKIQFFADADGDGFGNPDVFFEVCDPPEGTVDNADDCDDSDPLAFPGAIRGRDLDGDGYGSIDNTVESCLLEEGLSDTTDDCDDRDPLVNPGMNEDCETSQDDDCSGSLNDEDATGCVDWYTDSDEDGFAGGTPMCMCDSTSTHRSMAEEDCNDAKADINPDAAEICNDGIDNNCDGAAIGCGFTGDTDASTASYVYTGLVPNGFAGSDLLYADDLTGDGQDDLLIGAYGDSALTIVSGGDAAETTTGDHVRLTGTAGDNLGRDIVLPGDVNGDDVPDLIMGAPSAAVIPEDDSGIRSQSGSVNVYFGPIASLESLSEPDAQVFGPHGNAYLGRNMGQLGDFDGDGVADILAGGFDIKNILGQKVGAAFLLYGPIEEGESIDSSIYGAVDLTIYGEAEYDRFGVAMTAVGDWSGDGLPDFVIAAQDGNVDKGAVYAFESGSMGAAEGAWNASDADHIVNGMGNGARTGETLQATDDLDGDGLDDLLVGAPRRNLDGLQRGVAYFISSLASGSITSVSDAEFRGEVDNAHFGTGLTGWDGSTRLGDAGIAVGAPNADSGAVYVFAAPFEGSIEQSSAVGAVSGASFGDAFGSALIGGMDYDGEGLADLVVGAPDAESSKGRIYVLLGGAL